MEHDDIPVELDAWEFFRMALWESKVFIIATGLYTAIDIANRVYPNQLIFADKIPSFELWQWVSIWLAIAVFIIFRGAFTFAADLRREIIDLQTPNISVDFLELRSKHGLAQLFITIKNLSRKPIRALRYGVLAMKSQRKTKKK